MSKDAMKRIVNKDMRQIEKMNLSELGIHINFNEENIMKATAIIKKPKINSLMIVDHTIY